MMVRYTLDKSKTIEHRGKTLYAVLDRGEVTNAFAVEGVKFDGACEVRGGKFNGGHFNGGHFYGGYFYDGIFYGGVFHGGYFNGGYFNGGVFYSGIFYGGFFYEGKYLDGWLPLQIQGSRDFLNITDGKHIQIGCERGSVDWWRENYERVGKDNSYTPEQIKEYKRYIDLAAEMIKGAE